MHEASASDCQKSIFASLVDEGASSPATATPSRFHLNSSNSGREICKVAISLWEISCEVAVHAADFDFTGCSV